MNKITFTNGQAPYINDETLNQIQDNIENAIEEKQANIEELDGKITELSEGIDNSGTYSTTEDIKTGETWIDGKPIYRKVFTGKGKEFDCTIANAIILFYRGHMKSVYNSWWSIPSCHVEDGYCVYSNIGKTRDSLQIQGQDYYDDTSDYYIEILYTKTTD